MTKYQLCSIINRKIKNILRILNQTSLTVMYFFDPFFADLHSGLAESGQSGLFGNKTHEDIPKEKSPDHMIVDDGEISTPLPQVQKDGNSAKDKKVIIKTVCPDTVEKEGSRIMMVLEEELDDSMDLNKIRCDFGDITVNAKVIKKSIIECFTPKLDGGCTLLSLVCNGEKISNTVQLTCQESKLGNNLSHQPWLDNYGYSKSMLIQHLRSYFDFLSTTIIPQELAEKYVFEKFDCSEEKLRKQILSFLKKLSQSRLHSKSFPSFMMHSGLKLSLLQVFATLGMADIIALLLHWKKEDISSLSWLRQEDMDTQLCGVKGENALMWSCCMGHLDTSVLLVCWDWNMLNALDFQERSAIDIAQGCGHDHIAIVLQNLKDLIITQKSAPSNPTPGMAEHQINSSFSSLSETQPLPGVSSSSSAIFSFSSSFDSCPSDKCLECSGSNCLHQRTDSGAPSEKQAFSSEPLGNNADGETLSGQAQQPSEADAQNPINQVVGTSESENQEAPSSKAERRRIIMRRLIKRLSAKSKAGQIDIPAPPAGANPPARKVTESKTETKQQGLKRSHEDRTSNQSSPLSPEQIKIQQHVVQLTQLQQQQLKSVQQKTVTKGKTTTPPKPKEVEPEHDKEHSQTKDSIQHQLQLLHQQIALQQQQMQEVQKQQYQLIMQQKEMMKKSSEAQPSVIDQNESQGNSNDKESPAIRPNVTDCFVAPLTPKNNPTKPINQDNRSEMPASKSHVFNPNPLNLPDHLYALRDDEGNCYQNSSTDMNGEEASVYTLASQIIEALPNHIKLQGAPLPPFSSADFRAKDSNVASERTLSDAPTISMMTPAPPQTCSSQSTALRFPGDRQHMKKLPEVWRFGEAQLEEDSYPEYGANDGNFCFGTYRDVPGTPRSVYSSYSSSLSPASSLQSPVSFAPIEYEDLNPPSTAELNEFFTATSLDPTATGLEAEDFSQLTLTDNEQRELYEAAKVIHSAYTKGGEGNDTNNAVQESLLGTDSSQEIEAAVTIQKYFRRYKTFMYYRQMNEAATRIQAQFRAYSEHKRFRRSRDAAVLIQSQYRTYREHKQFLASKQAAVVIQQRYRSHYRKRKQQQQQQLQQQQQNHVTQSGAGPTSTSMLAGYAKGNGIHHYHPHQHHMSHVAGMSPNLQGNLVGPFSSHGMHQFRSHFSYPSTQNILPSNCVTAETPFSKIVVQHQPSSQQQHYASSAQSTMAAATAAAAAAAQCNFLSPDSHENLNQAVQDSMNKPIPNNEIGESAQETLAALPEFDLDSLPNLTANDSLFSDLY